jgi:hypothetical protein
MAHQWMWLLTMVGVLSPTVSTPHQLCCTTVQPNPQRPTTTTKPTAPALLWPLPSFVHYHNDQPHTALSPHLCLHVDHESHAVFLKAAFQNICHNIPSGAFRADRATLEGRRSSSLHFIRTLRIQLPRGSIARKQELSIDSNESYMIDLQVPVTTIAAPEIWGARHALETLFQLTDRPSFVPATVRDRPKYAWWVQPSSMCRGLCQCLVPCTSDDFFLLCCCWGQWGDRRGLLLDTARHYFSTHAIKRTMQAMAMNKYNVFHWHITDAQSFPLLLNQAPELALLGSHHPTQMYTKKDVAGLVSFAQAQGNGQGRRVAARVVFGCTVGQGLM